VSTSEPGTGSMVFHSPHMPHRPAHCALVTPQAEQP